MLATKLSTLPNLFPIDVLVVAHLQEDTFSSNFDNHGYPLNGVAARIAELINRDALDCYVSLKHIRSLYQQAQALTPKSW